MSSSDILSWRIDPRLPVVKLTAAGALAVLAYLFGRHDPVRWVLPGVVVLALAAWAARDLLAPVRLSADPTGVTVLAGFAGRRHLPWARIEGLRVDRRQRRGLRSELLEIDAGESLHLLSAQDLGAPPGEVITALTSLRDSAGGGP